MKANLNIGFEGICEWMVVNPDGTTEQHGKKKNLILDQGLDFIGYIYTAQLSQYCAVGTGQTAATVSDLGLDNEIARTNNLITSTGSTGSVWPNDYTCEHKRTFQFPAGSLDSSTDGSYYEVGFSPYSTDGTNFTPNIPSPNNLFSRLLFTINDIPTGIDVAIDQELRVIYTLRVVLPSTVTTGTINISGIGTIGYQSAIQNTRYADGSLSIALSQITPTGGVYTSYTASNIYKLYFLLEPPRYNNSFASSTYEEYAVYQLITYSSNTPLAPVGSGTLHTPLGLSQLEVTNSGPGFVEQTATFGTNQSNGTVYGITLGGSKNSPDWTYAGHAWRLLFDTPIEKADTHTLSFVIRKTWGRL